MADEKVPLLPPRHAKPAQASVQGIDGINSRKRGQGVRSWIRIDKEGNSRAMEVDKVTIMRLCNLPARDIRLLDPLFVYPSTILGREKAIVVNLEQIRCIITADEVLLLNSLDSYVLQYSDALQKRLAVKNDPSGSGSSGWRRLGKSSSSLSVIAGEEHGLDFSSDNTGLPSEGSHPRLVNESYLSKVSSAHMPFELLALEVALEASSAFLDSQALALEAEAYPLLDELTSKISIRNLELVRRLKSRLVGLTRRVQKVRDEIEQLMDDDDDMAEMYLTDKKEKVEGALYTGQTHSGIGVGGSLSAPVSPVCSPTGSRRLEKTFSNVTRYSSSRISGDESDVQELEMLLEAYFVVVDATMHKLTSLKEYIEDTEDFINIQLDSVRNQLIEFELLLTAAAFAVAIFGAVTGVFGMNIPISLFDEPRAFKWVLIIAGIGGSIIFLSFLWYFKRRGFMSL